MGDLWDKFKNESDESTASAGDSGSLWEQFKAGGSAIAEPELSPEERQRQIDEFNSGGEGGLLRSISRLPRAFKEGVENSMGSLANTITGGYYPELTGFDEEQEGMSYTDYLESQQRGTAIRNRQAAGDSLAGELALGASTAVGEMAPSLVAGAAVRPAEAAATVFGTMTATYGPQYYQEAKRKGKSGLESAAYASIMSGIDLATSLAGMKVAGKVGAVTLESIFSNPAVKKVSGTLLGTAIEAGEESTAQFLQGITDWASGVNPEALETIGKDTLKAGAIGAIIGSAVNAGSLAVDRAQQFMDNSSRSNARKLGLGETTAKERQQIAEQALSLTQTQETPDAQQIPEASELHENVPERPGPEVSPAAVPPEEGGEGIRQGGQEEAVGYSPELTSARKAWMAEHRKRLRLDELPEAERVPFQQSLDMAFEQKIPQHAQGIAQAIIAQPRALTDVETAGLVVHGSELLNQHELLTGQLAKQPEGAEPDPTLIAERERVEQDFDVLSQAIKMSGTEKGRNLAAQKLTINRDYSLLTVKTRAKAAKKKPLTQRDNQKISKAVDNLAAKERQLQTAIDKAKARLAELETHLDAGTLPEVKPRKPVSSKELKDLQDMIAAVRRSLGTSEAAQRKRLEATIAKLEAKLAAGELQLPGHRPAPLSPEIERLEFQRDKARNEVNVRINELKPKTFREIVREPFDLARTIITSMDLPPVFRQGGMISFGNPVRAGKAAGVGIKAMFSEQYAHKILKEIDSRPNAPLYARAKLYLADLDGLRIHQEEAYVGHLINNIPVLSKYLLTPIKNASERNYTVFLNKLRADTFDAMAASLPRNGEPTMEESRAIARYINVATGRGDFNARMDTALSEMAAYFFSPRYVASRFQAIVGQPLYRSPAGTRTIIAKEYGKMMAGVATVYSFALLAGAELDDDYKLRVGDSHIDLLFGMVQTARFLRSNAKAAANTIDSWRTGEERKLVYSESMGPWRFLRSKFSPFVAAVEDTRTGKDYMGEPTTLKGLAKNSLIPLSFRDIMEATEEQGVSPGLALWLVSLFGMGLQTWEANPATIER